MTTQKPYKNKGVARPTAGSRELRLAARQRGATRFNRPSPIGLFRDLVLRNARLVTEVVGGQHAIQGEAGARSTAYLRAQGYGVLRFWNPDVTENLSRVVETIPRLLADARAPSRRREGV